MNQVILIGRLANEPELSYTPQNQTAICRFRLAVSRLKKDDGADFISITVWGKQAEICDKYLSKGRQVAINGRIKTGSYEKDDGTRFYTTEVVASNVEFLGGGGQPAARSDESATAPATQQSFEDLPDVFSAVEENVPF